MGQRRALAAALVLAACSAKKASKVKATKPPNEYSTKNMVLRPRARRVGQGTSPGQALPCEEGPPRDRVRRRPFIYSRRQAHGPGDERFEGPVALRPGRADVERDVSRGRAVEPLPPQHGGLARGPRHRVVRRRDSCGNQYFGADGVSGSLVTSAQASTSSRGRAARKSMQGSTTSGPSRRRRATGRTL